MNNDKDFSTEKMQVICTERYPNLEPGFREIKFRGIGIESGEWYYGNLCTNEVHTVIVHFPYEYGEPLEFEYYFIKPETVGQYTGITDDNKALIYEGDIVSIELCFKEEIKCEVIYEDAAFLFRDHKNYRAYYFSEPTSMKVIGNIYENWELIYA